MKNLLAIILVFFSVWIFAQDGRLPTKEELLNKQKFIQEYELKKKKGELGDPAVDGNVLYNINRTTGPEQNCINAISVCQQTYTQSNSYQGFGSLQELSGTCLLTNETNSVWYVFTVQNSGTFAFTINTTFDYDFALFDISSIGCAGIPTATPVRCNFSATYGTTGLTLPPSASPFISVPASGSPLMPGLNVTAGQTFALIVDNFTGNATGYTLNFGGTAQIFDNIPPQISTSSITNCSSGILTINTNELIGCGSLNPSGAGFSITGPSTATVTGLSGVGCGSGAYTNQLQLAFNTAGMVSGTYTVNMVANAIQDKCGNPNGATSFVFNYLAPITINNSAPNICSGQLSTLTAVGGPGTGATFAWSNGANTVSTNVSPASNTTYQVTVTYGGCTATASTTVNLTLPPVASVNPAQINICSGNANITATATIGGNPCTNCNYVWSGAGSQTDNGVPSSTINGAAGTYFVTVTSPSGCVGNTVSATITYPSPSPAPACNVIYVSPTGTGTGLTTNSPTNLPNAISLAACNNVVIKMTTGTYNLNDALNLTSFITLEGGYNATFTTKTSAAGATLVHRTTTNPEGPAHGQRLVAFYANSAQHFRLQDITIATAAANQPGMSTYGLHLNNCSNYNIIRTRILPGNAAAGLAGSTGVSGTSGGSGQNGQNGDGDDQNFNTHASVALGGVSPCGCPGGNGGQGGFSGNINGTAGIQGGCTGGGGGGGGGAFCTVDCSQPGSANGGNGTAGSPGAVGATGTSGAPGSVVGLFWQPGGQGGTGMNGQCGRGGGGGGGGGSESGWFCNDGSGGDGGGGGGGGAGGTGGTGGYGGGSSYGVFIVNNGANGIINHSLVTPGTAGPGGAGGTGGAGGAGGAGGFGGWGGCDIGPGGIGGAGGAGGTGGTGGSGSPGESIAVRLVSGSALSINNNNFNLAIQPIINVANLACTNVDINHNTGAASPVWSSFGAGSSPPSGAGANVLTQYSSLGRKTVEMNSNTYLDFNNIVVSPPSPGTIVASAAVICPGTANFSSSIGNVPGYTYQWSVAPAASIATPTATTTDITFTNFTSNPIVYTVTLTVTSDCCGPLSPITYDITVNPIPASPTVSNVNVCLGGSGTALVTAPSGATFEWYTAPVAGTFLGSGASYTLNPVNTTTTYYVQSNGAGGCNNTTRTPVTFIPTALTPPTAIHVTTCNPGVLNLGINPVPGITTYSWYDAPTGGTLLQSSSSLNYSVNIPTFPGSQTVYVSSVVPGCTESSRVPVIGSVIANPMSINPVIVPNDSICVGQSSTITLNPSGGNGIYTYSWSPTGATGGSETVSPGATTGYNITIGSDGCQQIFNIPIYVLPNPVASAVTPSNALTCTATQVSLDATGSQSGMNYSWAGPGIVSGGTTTTPQVNAPGNYTITVTIPNVGCTSSATVVVPQDIVVPDLNPGSGGTLTCSTPSVNLLASSGTSGVTYVWSNSATTAGTTVNAPGSYTVTVTNPGNGCTATGSVTVLQDITLPDANAGTGGTLTCAVSSINLNATSVTPGVSYAWSNGATTSATSVSSPGNYTVTVTDPANGCTATSTTTVTQNITAPNANAGTANTLSCTTLSVNLNASSTTTGVTYNWSNGSGTAGTSVSSPGTYTVTVTDPVNSCTATSTVTVAQNITAPGASAGADQNQPCNVATIDITGSSTTSGVDFVWTSIGGTVVSGANSATAQVSGSGQYILTVTNPVNGCSQTDTMTVTAAPAPSVAITGSGNVSCAGGNDGNAQALASGGTAGYVYVWSNSSAGPSITNLAAGLYVVTVTDGNNCTTTAAVTITEPMPVNLALVDTLSPDCGTPNGNIEVSASGGTAPYSYSWADTSATGTILDNVGSGSFTVYALDNNGCQDSLVVTLVCKVNDLFIPQLLSPNGDNKNDIWVIQNLQGYPNNKVKIFNRWGNLVFEADPYQNNWDGKSTSVLQIGNNTLPAGTYFYVIDLYGNGSRVISSYLELQP